MAKSAMLNPMPHILLWTLFLNIFKGIQSHIDASIPISMNSHLPAFLMSP